MENQANHTQRDKTFELEKRLSELEEENKALREEIKTLHSTYQTDRKNNEEALATTTAMLRELEEVFMIGTYDMDTLTSSVRASANMRKICNMGWSYLAGQ